MKANTFTILSLAALLSLPIAATAAPPRVLEDAREVAPSMLTLPSAIDGDLAIQGCATCKRVTLRLSREVRFYVGKTEVSYKDLQLFLRSHPQSPVLVVSPIGQPVVSRIQASNAFAK